MLHNPQSYGSSTISSMRHGKPGSENIMISSIVISHKGLGKVQKKAAAIETRHWESTAGPRIHAR